MKFRGSYFEIRAAWHGSSRQFSEGHPPSERLNRGSFAARTSVIAMVGLLGSVLFLVSCSKDKSSIKPPDVDYYTCTMHPSVRSQDPNAKCPICSMSLVAVKKRASGDSSERNSGTAEPAHQGHGAQATRQPGGPEAPMPFTIPLERQQQIGVTYAEVAKRPLSRTLRVSGTVAYDKQRYWDYVTRVEGYVQKLFVSSGGQLVESNAPIVAIYSPDLLTTQREFVDVLHTRDEARKQGNEAVHASTERLVESARQRLRLWNVGEGQIAELEKTRQPQELLTLHAPFKGIVQNVGVRQGQRVMLGERIVDVADLSMVWVWAQFYQDELPMLKTGLSVSVTTSAFPGEEFKGKISIIDPFINETLRTGRVRIDVENAEMKLRPDMYVDANLEIDMGEGLAVPVSGVLPTGKHNLVFLDKGEGKLEPRFVQLGRKYGDFYEVQSGLTEGEQVVTSANFLIDAEAKVQGALKSW